MSSECKVLLKNKTLILNEQSSNSCNVNYPLKRDTRWRKDKPKVKSQCTSTIYPHFRFYYVMKYLGKQPFSDEDGWTPTVLPSSTTCQSKTWVSQRFIIRSGRTIHQKPLYNPLSTKVVYGSYIENHYRGIIESICRFIFSKYNNVYFNGCCL